MVAPQRSWHGATYVLSRGAEEFESLWSMANGCNVTTWAGERDRLIAISGGRNSGTLRIARSFDCVLETALQRIARCECGEETSCYGCLRNFRNQAFHDQLRRGDALRFLGRLMD